MIGLESKFRKVEGKMIQPESKLRKVESKLVKPDSKLRKVEGKSSKLEIASQRKAVYSSHSGSNP